MVGLQQAGSRGGRAMARFWLSNEGKASMIGNGLEVVRERH